VQSFTTPKMSSQNNTQMWVNDTSLTNLTEIISKQLHKDQLTSPEVTTDTRTDEELTPHQHIRFNLLRHRGVVCDIPALQLFKDFTIALRTADLMLTILPYEASKQHYSLLNTTKQYRP
jgi:hypothetical protein